MCIVCLLSACRELLADDRDQLECLLDACMTQQCTKEGYSVASAEAKSKIQMMTRLLHQQQQDEPEMSQVKKEGDEPTRVPR